MEQHLVLPAEESQTPSPFLPGTAIQYAIDSTSLGWLKTCPRLYQYRMIEGWSSKGESVHLRFGIEIHQALQDYELSRAAGIEHEDALHDSIATLVRRIADWDPEPTEGKRSEQIKSKDNLLRTVVWYLDHYYPDPAETFIMENGKPAVEVSFRFELDWGPESSQIEPPYEGTRQPYLLCGHLDRVVRFADHLYVMDHKTTTSTPGAYYFNQYEPNNQMSLYTIASQIIMKSPIRGVIIDVIQVANEFSRFTRGFTYRTPDQVDEWLTDLCHWLALAEKFAANNYWPQNDTACDKFGGCAFREVCSRSPQVRERWLEGNFERRPWNPLEVR